MFALVVDGDVVGWGALPVSARRLDTGEAVYDLAGVGEKWQRAAGWFPVVESEPPTVAAGEQADYTVELDADGRPIQVWHVDPASPKVLKRRDLAKQIATLRQWSADADAVVVTTANAVQVLGVVTDRLGVFFARFADLLEVLELED